MREFAEREIAPKAQMNDRAGKFDRGYRQENFCRRLPGLPCTGKNTAVWEWTMLLTV
jgi:hypothetical protein